MNEPIAKPNSFFQPKDFTSGVLLLINKPLGWTSFDAVNKVKFSLKNKLKTGKLKVGHAGTLDPLATGLLVICTGRMTKAITQLTLDDKIYTGIIRLGTTTPSYDLETAPENPQPATHLTEKDITNAMAQFTGPIVQMPPIFSAKKVDGKRAYDHARAGTEVQLRTANIVVHSFQLLSFSGTDIAFEVRCSKGTYIRSLAHDLGQSLGCGAHLAALCRTGSGQFLLTDAMSPGDFEARISALQSLNSTLTE